MLLAWSEHCANKKRDLCEISEYLLKLSRPVDVLTHLGLLDWPTLTVGARRGWATAADVAEFATNWLVEHPADNDPRILELAMVDASGGEGVLTLLDAYVVSTTGASPGYEISREVDRWRLASLKLLVDSDSEPEAIFGEFEELYAEFGYPEDMAPCGRYFESPAQQRHGWTIGDQEESPIECMRGLINSLEAKLCPRRT